jgi:hypothetical protein
MLQLHDDHHGATTPAGVEPLVIPDWWCTECGRGEADETTRLCPDCTYMAADGQVRLVPLPPRVRLDDGLRRLEQAQQLIAAAQIDAERILERVEGDLYTTLACQADTLHQVGATLLAAHAALSYARLGAEAAR